MVAERTLRSLLVCSERTPDTIGHLVAEFSDLHEPVGLVSALFALLIFRTPLPVLVSTPVFVT